MLMKLLSDEETVRDVMNLAHDSFNLEDMIQIGLEKELLIEYIISQCWVVSFLSNDKEKLYALLILEWTTDREASIHFCMFNRGNILKGWKMFIKEYSEYFDLLQTYIPHERHDVLRIAKAIGFEFTKEKRHYHGRYSRESS